MNLHWDRRWSSGLGALVLLLALSAIHRTAVAQGSDALKPVVRFEPEVVAPGNSVTITVQYFQPMREVTGKIRGVDAPLDFSVNTTRRVATAQVELPAGLKPGDYSVDLDVRTIANRLQRVQTVLRVGTAGARRVEPRGSDDLTVRIDPEVARPAAVIRIEVLSTRRIRGLPVGMVDGFDQPLAFNRDEDYKGGSRFIARIRVPNTTRNGSYRVQIEARQPDGTVLRERATLQIDQNAAVGRTQGSGLAVTVSPEVARPGDRITISARADRALRRAPTGSVSGSLVPLEFETEAPGRYVSRFRIPEDARNGSYRVEVEGNDANGVAVRDEAVLKVDRAAAATNGGDRQWNFTIALDPDVVRPGERVTIIARSNRALRQPPAGRFTNSPQLLEFEAVDGSDQTFRSRFRVPDDLRPGDFRIVVEATDKEGVETRAGATMRVDRDGAGGGATADAGRLRLTVTPAGARAGERVTIVIVADRPLRRAPRVTASNGFPLPATWEASDDSRRFTGRVRLPDTLRAGLYRLDADGVDEDRKPLNGTLNVTVPR